MRKLCILALFFVSLVSCSSLQFRYSTLNHVSNRAKFAGFTQPKVLSTDLFSINAPLTNGWFYNSNYGNSWQYFEFLQFQYQFNGWSIGNNWRYIDYAWTLNQFWRYPANRWAFDDWTYNIPPIVRRTPIRPIIQPVPYIREPRRERTRIVNPNPIRRNYNPVLTQPSPQIIRQSTPTRTRTMNTQPDVQRRPVERRAQTRVSVSNGRRDNSNRKN